jgi:hypothetical protein
MMLGLEFVIGVMLLGIMVVGIIRKFAFSGRITQSAEVSALRTVLKDADSAIGKDDPRKYFLRVVGEGLLQYELTAPVVLISTEELQVLAPFINTRLAAQETPDTERKALATFKDRMIQQNLWPPDAARHPVVTQPTITPA